MLYNAHLCNYQNSESALCASLMVFLCYSFQLLTGMLRLVLNNIDEHKVKQSGANISRPGWSRALCLYPFEGTFTVLTSHITGSYQMATISAIRKGLRLKNNNSGKQTCCHLHIRQPNIQHGQQMG